MLSTLLFFHSIFRWLILISIGYTLYRSFYGFLKKSQFKPNDDKLRHWTATVAHIQLLLGMVMYFKSPAVAQYRIVGHKSGSGITEPLFFSTIHISMMITAIVILTFGSAIAKRQAEDHKKFKVILIFFGIAFIIILAAIPWPFSPLAQRPLIRNF